jgi:hypothetical protein
LRTTALKQQGEESVGMLVRRNDEPRRENSLSEYQSVKFKATDGCSVEGTGFELLVHRTVAGV